MKQLVQHFLTLTLRPSIFTLGLLLTQLAFLSALVSPPILANENLDTQNKMNMESLASDSCVILLHGLARGKGSMKKLAKALASQQYQVVNQAYPSRKAKIEDLAPASLDKARQLCDGTTKQHVVTHSMGAILLRYYLSQNEWPSLGRVVMLGPPNHGSEIVDKLRNVPGFKLINGRAGQQLGTEEDGFVQQLGPADFDLGIIAGNKSFDPILKYLLPKPNDGKVSEASTRLKGMHAHITLPVTHTFMMRNKEVIAQTLYYLEHGRFNEKP